MANTAGQWHALSVPVVADTAGHLYERLMRIMMLSVVKRASVPIKFWLLENFLSPTFKDWIPRMAKHYGFSVEFVTYKWPVWLRRQTEKQRIIWGAPLACSVGHSS